jgi:hypothetical protein
MAQLNKLRITDELVRRSGVIRNTQPKLLSAQKTITTALNNTDNGELCFVGTLRLLTLKSFLKIAVRQYHQSGPFKVLGIQATRHRIESRKPRTAFAKSAISVPTEGRIKNH